MAIATDVGKLSHCKRRQVGCVIVTRSNHIVLGYNGTPSGEDNCCEDDNGITKDSVIHAEDNAMRKFEGENKALCEGASLYVSLSPCKQCAEKIIDHKIKEVFYTIRKNTNLGLSLLEENGILVQQLDTKGNHE